MKIGFYPRLAADGIRKNRRTFLPFILTCAGMVMMFYIIMYLASGDILSSTFGAETMQQIFALGSWVIMVFSGIFLFYTNSFLMKRRKKEFGLYSILGMGKGNIARILFWETVIVAVISIVLGLIGGIAFSKMAELGMVRIMGEEANYRLSVSTLAIKRTLEVFGVIFLLLLLNSVLQVRFSSAISLLRSESAGEKPPKANWLVGIMGVLLLAAAYWLAVTIKDPVEALLVFFAAVVMVIIGTYMVMIAGSVAFCRLLQKNKGYYYKPNHFVSVSSMAYRMKRNGAGLASICILATMVLVTIASTSCLYFGCESVIASRYPRDVNLLLRADSMDALSDENTENIIAAVDGYVKSNVGAPENAYHFRSLTISGGLNGNVIEPDITKLASAADARMIYFIPLSDYNAVMGENETLAPGEALLYVNRNSFKADTLSVSGGATFRIKKRLRKFIENGETSMNMLTSLNFVVPDLEAAARGLAGLANFNGDPLLRRSLVYNFDIGPDDQEEFINGLSDFLRESGIKESLGFTSCTLESHENERRDYFSIFGSLFYIGIIMSLVFLIAAVLIIYYKQISEGYEDQSRFEIMRKVGMTKREIRRSINSQLLTVFFLPLAMAALHIVFAFPIIRKLLLLFDMDNIGFFAATTGISVLLFVLFYTVVYKLTSNVYYNIVSETRK